MQAGWNCFKLLWLTVIAVALATLMVFAVAAETEDNDTWATANSFYIGDSVSGKVDEELDVDFYRFYVSYPGTLSLVFDHTDLATSDEYWTITIYDYNKNQISKQKVSGNGTSYELEDVHVNAGTYYVSVAKGSYYTDQSYTFSTSFVYDLIHNHVYTESLSSKFDKKVFHLPIYSDSYLTF